MASDTVLRLRILRALTVLLEGVETLAFGITDVSGSPLSSLAGRVFRGRVIFGEKDPIPMLSILEVPIPLDQIASPPDSSYSSGTWELLIQGFVKDDVDHPTDPAHVLMAAVKKRLAGARRQNRKLGQPGYGILGMADFITGMRIGSGVVRPPDEVSAKAYFWLNLSLDIAEDLGDPFED